MKYKLITVEGNIGSGKTSLARKLSTDYKAKLLLETFADNPFLQKFFENQKNYALGTEMFFLAERYEQLKDEIGTTELVDNKIIIDYLFSKSLLYAKVNLDEIEYNLYSKIFNILNPRLPKADIIIYLHSGLDRLVANIFKRGREFEKTVRKDYLQQIENSYMTYFMQHPEEKVILLDVSQADFVHNFSHYAQIKKLLEQDHPFGINKFTIA
jgi:deoxyguanosine kinase